MKTNYRNLDPRKITVKYTGNCAKCGTRLNVGQPAYYWPADRKIFCIYCGESDYKSFLSSVADEAVYNGAGNPF